MGNEGDACEGGVARKRHPMRPVALFAPIPVNNVALAMRQSRQTIVADLSNVYSQTVFRRHLLFDRYIAVEGRHFVGVSISSLGPCLHPKLCLG